MIVRLVLVIMIAAVLEVPAQQPRKITINYPTRSGASWPLFIAKEGGFYKKYGFDATLVFANHPAGAAMVIGGEAQMSAYSLESSMQATARDTSLVMVGNMLSKAVFALMARKDIASVKDLKGKRLAVSTIGDPPYNYANALLRQFGMTSRDVQWVPVGTDANGRVVALETGRAEATLLTAPAYFKLEAAGYKTLAHLTDYDEIFASTMYLMKKTTVASDPGLVESLIKAHAEAIERFYRDKAFAVKSYQVYDPQSTPDVERFYDIYAKGNLFERIPYVLTTAPKAVLDQQSDPQLIAAMRSVDFSRVVDNSFVDRLVKQGYFEKLFGSGVKAEQDRKAKLAFK